MQKTIQSISQISFFFFLIFGLLHISASFLVAQHIVNRTDWFVFNTIDLPFLFSALLYGTSRLSLTLGDIFGNEKIPFVILAAISICLFLFALYLNFIFPDAKLG